MQRLQFENDIFDYLQHSALLEHPKILSQLSRHAGHDICPVIKMPHANYGTKGMLVHIIAAKAAILLGSTLALLSRAYHMIKSCDTPVAIDKALRLKPNHVFQVAFESLCRL